MPLSVVPFWVFDMSPVELLNSYPYMKMDPKTGRTPTSTDFVCIVAIKLAGSFLNAR